jgi:hypothetical protein
MEELKLGMLMQKELYVTLVHQETFQGYNLHLFIHCSLLNLLLMGSFNSCSILDLKCSPVEPVFVSAAASRG